MGQPTWRNVQVLPVEYIDRVEGTRRTETSKYPQEKMLSPEQWRAKRGEAKPRRRDSRQAFPSRGRGTSAFPLPRGQGVTKSLSSRTALEKPAAEGDSPVRERHTTSFESSQVPRNTWNSVGIWADHRPSLNTLVDR